MITDAAASLAPWAVSEALARGGYPTTTPEPAAEIDPEHSLVAEELRA